MNVNDDALQQAVAAAAAADYPAEAVEADLAIATGDLSESSDELSAISRQVEATGNVAESMESFLNDFMTRVPEGEWDKRTSRQYRVGMTQILAAHGFSVDPDTVSASFESAGVTQTNDENREESKQKSNNIITKLYEALKAALAALGRAITKFASRVLNNSTVLRKAGQQLMNQVRSAKGEVPAGEFEGKPAWGVYFQMKEHGGEPTAGKIVTDIGMEVNSLLGGWDQSFMNQVRNLGNASGEVEHKNTTKIKISGGVTLEVTGVDEHLKGAGISLAEATIKAAKSEYPEGKIPYLSKHECQQVAQGIIANADAMKKVSEMGKPVIEEVEKLIAKLKTKDGATDDAKAALPLARKLLSKYPLAAQVLAPQIGVVSMNAWRHANASLAKAGKKTEAAK